jgi:hypothetical protein
MYAPLDQPLEAISSAPPRVAARCVPRAPALLAIAVFIPRALGVYVFDLSL